MSIASIDPGLYVDSFPTWDLRQALSMRHGLLRETILTEIDNRLKHEVNQKKVKTQNKHTNNSASINNTAYATTPPPIPDTDAPLPPAPSPTGAVNEDPWQA
jgi:hypothetical protein